MKGLRIATLTLALAANLAFSAQDAMEAKLQQACASLQRSPFDAAELQTLLDVSRHATNSPALRSRAMAAYSLTLLMQGNTNSFERALQILRSAYPETAPLIKVSRDNAFAACEACAGSQKIATACPTCKGTRLVFKPSGKIRENYNALLTNIVGICQENTRYTEQFSLASRETDTAKRIALLQNLLQEFPHRTDLVPALNLMEKAVNARDTQVALRLKQQAREQSDRELEALRKLRDSDDLNGAIATLAAYLKGQPNTPALMELQTLLDDLIATRNRKALTRNILCGVLWLFGVLFVFTCLRPFLFRKKPDHFGPLPGMDKLDKTQFTDPLSLTSKESRQRHTKEP